MAGFSFNRPGASQAGGARLNKGMRAVLVRTISITVAALLATGLLTGAALARPAKAPAKPQPATSFTLDKARIDRALKDMVARGRVAGVEALVWQRGAERYYGAFGDADREAKRPFRRDTIVQIFSMTKPVTGVALMQLWEQGKFGLDDPLSRYLPDFANVNVVAGKDANGVPILRAPSRPILIRDIMRHTAGFVYHADGGPVDNIIKADDPLALGNTLTDFGEKLARIPLLFDPGSQWRYSAAVDVQALLVQKLSGMKFEDYVRTRIFQPLGMKDAGWTQPQANRARFAWTYVPDAQGRLVRQDDRATLQLNFLPKQLTQGGAGIAATIDDYARFARMLLNGGTLDGAQILKPSTIRLMATDQLDPRITDRYFLPSKGNVGFGLDFAVRKGQPLSKDENRGTTGEFFWDGYNSTLFWVDPANDLVAVFFTQKPFDGTLHRDFRAAVYGPDYVGPTTP